MNKDIKLEDLNYGKTQDDDEFVVYQELEKKFVRKEITFVKNKNVVELLPKIDGNHHYFTRLTMEELQAIHNKCKELGMLDG